jgi:hypothetical protein
MPVAPVGLFELSAEFIYLKRQTEKEKGKEEKKKKTPPVYFDIFITKFYYLYQGLSEISEKNINKSNIDIVWNT